MVRARDMHASMVVGERSRVGCDPDLCGALLLVEVDEPLLATPRHTIRLVFTEPGQIEDLIASCTALLFDFLTPEQVEDLRPERDEMSRGIHAYYDKHRLAHTNSGD